MSVETNSSPRFVSGLSGLVASYDTFLIDQWGVLHGGAGIYAGVHRALEELAANGKQSIIITNSSKSNAVNVSRLEKWGIPRGSYTELVSSAQVLRDNIVRQRGMPWENLGTKAFIVADGDDAVLFEGSRVVRVYNVDEADFVVLLSVEGSAAIEPHSTWMRSALAKGIPLVGPSADAQSVASDGIHVGLGAICNYYRNLGGNVTITGKPEILIYEECERLLGQLTPVRTIAVGDQTGSDVFGAHRVGYHAALVGTGAAETLFANSDGAADWRRKVRESVAHDDEIPEWILPRFEW